MNKGGWMPRYRCWLCQKAEWAKGGRYRECPNCGAAGPHRCIKFGFDGRIRSFQVLPKKDGASR